MDLDLVPLLSTSHQPPASSRTIFTNTSRPSMRMPPSSTMLRRLSISYAPDWILTIVLAAAFFSLDKVHGFWRSFSLTDTSLLHTYAVKERVPIAALYAIAIIAPAVLQQAVNFCTIRTWWDTHCNILGLILSLSITGSVTQFTKITVGRPRPDIISRCHPIAGSIDPTFGLSTASICTQTDIRILRDGFRSFPSGHASLSFAGLGFFSFYLAGKLHLFDHRGHTGKAWLAITPLSGAALVAISRSMDYRHHWHDLVAGSILGLTVAFFCYRQYYPSLSSTVSHLPYSPRVDVDSLPLHHSRPSHDANNEPSEQNAVPLTTQDNDGRETAEDSELGRTARRGGPGPLEEVWKDGEGERPEELASV